MNLNFFFEVLIGGLLSGIMYALVALGFVLIYKASGVFNFAQGSMVFFAALTCVSLTELGLPLWAAILVSIGVMALLGLAIERFVLRPLVNQPEISLFMATIGLTFFIEGMAQLMWGSDVKRLDLGIEDVPIESMMNTFNIVISRFDVTAAAICALLVTGLALFSRAPRSVAHCVPWQMITRQRSPSGFPCSRSGALFGGQQDLSRWSRACCGDHAMACSFR